MQQLSPRQPASRQQSSLRSRVWLLLCGLSVLGHSFSIADEQQTITPEKPQAAVEKTGKQPAANKATSAQEQKKQKRAERKRLKAAQKAQAAKKQAQNQQKPAGGSVPLIENVLTPQPYGPVSPSVAEQAKILEARAAGKPAAVKELPFIRIRRDKDGTPLALETSIVRYVSTDKNNPATLDLIGAVHVGDKKYYELLNKEFVNYDAMLYELVAPKGTRVPKGGRGGDMLPVAMMKRMLDLESQMEFIDYSKKNFVHADMSPKDIAAAMKARGETGFSLAMGVFRDMMQQSSRMAAKQRAGEAVPDISLFDLLFNRNGKKMKITMALQLADSGSPEALGKTLNTLLVQDRNKAALKVFVEQVKAGKRKLALFYGAAHMPDFEKRLLEDHKMKRDNVRWVTAWDLK